MHAKRVTGPGLVALALLAPVGAAGPAIALLSSMRWLEWVRADVPQRTLRLTLAIVFHALLAGIQVWGVRRAARVPRGTRGRGRALLLSAAAVLLAASAATSIGLLGEAARGLGNTPVFGLGDMLELSPRRLAAGTLVALSVAGAGLVVVAGALSSCWFLMPPRVRSRLWLVADAGLLAATVVTTLRYSLTPSSAAASALVGPSLRLASTLALGLRLGVRALPYMLDGIERLNMYSLVASRHLRAKKSGFLAAISMLSILAVTVSCCALTTTLSVMGGFRQDLKRKILGNNAHIVVSPERGAFSDSEAVVERIEAEPRVTGVSPYVSGEVMVSSASNLAGAVLRGIDTARIGDVTDLPSNMRVGSLGYLRHPEKLLDLPPDVLHMQVPSPTVKRLDDEKDAPKAEGKLPLLENLDRMLEDAMAGKDFADKPPKGGSAGSEPADVLPGVVVGQELARSLRLYLGDEVNIVSPLGALGPTGPMPKSRPFRVAGIFYTGMYEYDMKFVYTLLPTAQRFLSTDHRVHGIEVKVESPSEAPEVASSLQQAIGRKELRAQPWQELNKNLFGALALERLAMFIALGIAILVASFCIIGTLTLMVQEKGREVAILKAMGTPDRAIVGIFVLEGTLIGLFGAALGLALGYAMCFAAEHFGVRLNPEVYYIDRLPVHIDPAEFAGVGIAAIFVCLFVTIYPALLASRLRPVEALRYE